mmetsp:Transcript_55255/g.147522  ORF Transcript_55255/g.147522 Transcript_55255/m.147522 type:complete len:211 (+) Transcript_55255:1093-1725(+)
MTTRCIFDDSWLFTPGVSSTTHTPSMAGRNESLSPSGLVEVNSPYSSSTLSWWSPQLSPASVRVTTSRDARPCTTGACHTATQAYSETSSQVWVRDGTMVQHPNTPGSRPAWRSPITAASARAARASSAARRSATVFMRCTQTLSRAASSTRATHRRTATASCAWSSRYPTSSTTSSTVPEMLHVPIHEEATDARDPILSADLGSTDKIL